MIYFLKHRNYNKAPGFVRGEGPHDNKGPRERSFKSYCNLLVVNSENYYLDRLTADIYEGNITYDVFNYMSYIN